MAKGQIEKEQVINTILDTFQGAFQVDKEIRIPMQDTEGNPIQIKIVCTCATKLVDSPFGDTTTFTAGTDNAETPKKTGSTITAGAAAVEPSEEEKNKVDEFLKKMGIM